MDATTLAGERLGNRYRLAALIGRGGLADVWRAEDELVRRDVAVKLARVPLDPDEGDGARMDAEAWALAAASHPNLVTLFDVGRHDDRPYLVLRLVEGPTLSSVLARQGPRPPQRVAEVGAALAGALAQLHALGVVHRDVKPSNVLLDHDGTPQLTDLGIARVVGLGALTQTGTTLGTAAYMAPEQVRGEPVTGAVDVYALGLVLLESLTGRREYPGPALEAAVARLHRPPRIPEDLPAGWRDLLAAATATAPADRPDAVLLAERLLDLAEAAPSVGPVPPVAADPTDPPVAAVAPVAPPPLAAGSASAAAPDPAPDPAPASPSRDEDGPRTSPLLAASGGSASVPEPRRRLGRRSVAASTFAAVVVAVTGAVLVAGGTAGGSEPPGSGDPAPVLDAVVEPAELAPSTSPTVAGTSAPATTQPAAAPPTSVDPAPAPAPVPEAAPAPGPQPGDGQPAAEAPGQGKGKDQGQGRGKDDDGDDDDGG